MARRRRTGLAAGVSALVLGLALSAVLTACGASSGTSAATTGSTTTSAAASTGRATGGGSTSATSVPGATSDTTPAGEIGQAQVVACQSEAAGLQTAVELYQASYATPPTSTAQLLAAGLIDRAPLHHAIGPGGKVIGRAPCP